MRKLLMTFALMGMCCSGFANPNDDNDGGGGFLTPIIEDDGQKHLVINGPIRAVYEDGYLRFFFDTDLGFVTCSVRNANYDENWVTTMNSYLKEGDMYIGQQSGEFFITIVTEAGTVFTSTCTLIQNNSTEE